MKKKYDNDFKIMLVELLQSGRRAKELSFEYGVKDVIIRRWRREYEAKDGDFSKKEELSPLEEELKAITNEFKGTK